MESGHAVTAIAPVLAAGVGVRYDGRWVLRTVSFRLDQSDLGGASLGIVTERSPAASALIGLLAGKIAPDYGSLRVLGYDMGIPAARAAVRPLDRMALTPWADVALGAAPVLIARKARLAAACVHQPKLLLIDSLLDHLQPLDRTVLADVIRDLRRDTALIAIGSQADSLELACDQVISLRGGILVGSARPVIPQGAITAAPIEIGDRPR